MRGLFLALVGMLPLLAGGCSGRPAAPDVIRLTYGSPFSSAHPFSQADQAWIAEVQKRSAGRVHIDAWWGGSVISSDNNVTELRHGLTDIALISPIYARSGMEVIKAQSGFYGPARTIDQQLFAYHCAASRFPVFDEELHGMKVLAVAGGALIHVIMRDRAVGSLDDLRGLRLRAPSELLPVLRPLGVDVLTMPMGDVYSALSKGMIDGLVAPADTLKTLHFGEVARHFSDIEIARGAYPARAIRLETWTRLPADIQQLMSDLQPFWETEMKRRIELAQADGLQAGRRDRMVFDAIAASEQQRFDGLYDASAERTARSLDERGQQGTAILQTIQSASRTGQCATPARDSESRAGRQ